ncbi:MAG: cation transporter [Bryobacteraceae bacterium]
MSESPNQNDGGREAQQQRFAMRLSLWFGLLMLVGKISAWWFTKSAAILSDAAESVIHVVAVVFAFFALHLSQRPANARGGIGVVAFLTDVFAKADQLTPDSGTVASQVPF